MAPLSSYDSRSPLAIAPCFLILLTVILTFRLEVFGPISLLVQNPSLRKIISSEPRSINHAESAQVSANLSLTSINDKSSPYFHYNDKDLDLAVIGFPKTATTTLLRSVLGQHKEIHMLEHENCDIRKPNGDELLLDFLKNKPMDEKRRRWGIKCPTMVRDTHAIENLSKLSTNYTRLVVGVRRPTLWFQSFYNYRVTEVYAHNKDPSKIPTPNEILKSKTEWEDVSISYSRFDLFLKQLAKVPLDAIEMKEMLGEKLWPKRISPNKFKIFIYTVEQLGDEDNSTRQFQFQKDLQEFLRLETPFPDLRTMHRSNVNNKTHHPEFMDICDEEHDELRLVLMRQGKKASDWIRKKFIHAEDVVVSNVEHFNEVLKTWGQNPCGDLE